MFIYSSTLRVGKLENQKRKEKIDRRYKSNTILRGLEGISLSITGRGVFSVKGARSFEIMTFFNTRHNEQTSTTSVAHRPASLQTYLMGCGFPSAPCARLLSCGVHNAQPCQVTSPEAVPLSLMHQHSTIHSSNTSENHSPYIFLIAI